MEEKNKLSELDNKEKLTDDDIIELIEEPKTFRDKNKNLIQLFFAIKNNVATERITESELKNLLKSLRKSHIDYFKNSINFSESNIDPGIIIDKKENRKIIISSNSLEYTEKKLFNKENFNQICQRLYDFYVETKQVDPEDIRLIGKVYNFIFTLNNNAVDHLKNRTGIYAEKELGELSLKSTIIEGDKNIHIHIIGKKAIEAEGENAESENKNLHVKLDINNRDQVSGVGKNTFLEIIKYADDFSKNSLLEILNSHFG